MPFASDYPCIQRAFGKKIFMPLAIPPSALFERFIQPLLDLVPGAFWGRDCPRIKDEDWLSIGVQRVLKDVPSSRAFLQKLGFGQSEPFGHTLFFENLQSDRRLQLCDEMHAKLCHLANGLLADPLAEVECLAGFDLYAGDGHYHAASAHDKIHDDGKKYPPGHFFALNLRTHTLHPLTLSLQSGMRKSEHDMHALKRQDIASLRQGAPKGRKVLYVWDRAGIDFEQWQRWKQGSGIYFLSRQKKNMCLETIRVHDWERDDPHNAGVLSDHMVESPEGYRLRRIEYRCPVTLKHFQFLTNLPLSIPPGLIAHLYKMRWDEEKVFDQIKNKFGVKKAWGKSQIAKAMQARFICMAHNLLLLFEQKLEQDEGITNQPERQRRAQRLEKARQLLAEKGDVLPRWQEKITRMTQRSVKFIRWTEDHFWRQTPWSPALDSLRRLYARL